MFSDFERNDTDFPTSQTANIAKEPAATPSSLSSTKKKPVASNRKKALLMEARKERVGWVDSASRSQSYSSNLADDKEPHYDGMKLLRSTAMDVNIHSSVHANNSEGHVGGSTNGDDHVGITSSTLNVIDTLYHDLSERQRSKRVWDQLVSQLPAEDVQSITANFESLHASGEPEERGGVSDASDGYDVFIQRLRSPQSADLVQGMRHFVSSLETSDTEEGIGIEPAVLTASSIQLPGGKTIDLPKLNLFGLSGRTNITGSNPSLQELTAPKENVTQEQSVGSPLLKRYASQISSYLLKTNNVLKNHPLWNSDTDDAFRVQGSLPLETFLYQKCHTILQKALRLDSQTENDVLDRQIQSLGFVTWEHLDLPILEHVIDSKLWSAPIHALHRIRTVHAPRSKLSCLMDVYRGINEALAAASIVNASENTDTTPKPAGADDVLPAIILAILHAKPVEFCSELVFCQLFCDPDALRGEAGYVLTNVYGAVQFLKTVEDSSSFSIGREEYAAGLIRCREELELDLDAAAANEHDDVDEEQPVNAQKRENKEGDSAAGFPVDISASVVRMARLRGETIDLKWALREDEQLRNELRETLSNSEQTATCNSNTSLNLGLPPGFHRKYTFLGRQPDDLKLSELPLLLSEYHKLVQVTETLIVDRTNVAAAEQKKRLRMVREQLTNNALAADMDLRKGD
eukprot:CAMPEP_0194353292 /NCGR_PEP_ID=MMETSP0174-20130528/1617_1 /TAXON_ID=216777 /ORGANISM="Proboscia alata, Strain PI-D3" /LENGTH=689 /DNA_ID=CAMNT_0039121763 /DNA_START=224 /DNA_END=2293 /DNA_ORIENTATION=+